MIRTACPLLFVCAIAAAPPAGAQDKTAPAAPAPPVLEITTALSTAPEVPLASAAPQVPMASALRRKDDRPGALIPLYASFATLQGLDYASTTRALANGAGREANPVMRGIVNNRPAFIAVKAAAAAGVILAGEKMWKKNRVGAVLFVVGANAAMAIVVGRNYAIR